MSNEYQNTTELFNLNNWTGMAMDQSFDDEGRFEMYDYNWQVKDIHKEGTGGGWFTLASDDGITDTIYDLDGDLTLGRAIILASQWIANHV